MALIAIPTGNYLFLGKPMLREAKSNPDRGTLRRDNCLDPTGSMNCNHTIYWEGDSGRKGLIQAPDIIQMLLMYRV